MLLFSSAHKFCGNHISALASRTWVLAIWRPVTASSIARSASSSFSGDGSTTKSAAADAAAFNIIQPQNKAQTRAQKISKAMQAYLERAQEYDKFMEVQNEEFEIGKRHLANMMGLDPDMISQEDIDRCIEYLFPSGLFEKKARPMMKPPEEVFPRQKAAQFDFSGRPFHTMFYTGKPNYYQILHDAVMKMTELNKFEDQMIKNGVIEAPADCKASLSDSRWLNIAELQGVVLESLSEDQYRYFTATLDRLAEHPYSGRAAEFINKFRKPQAASIASQTIEPLKFTEDGRPFMEAEGQRNTARAHVTLYGKGTGLVSVNGKGIEYFEQIQDRIQVMFPIQFCNMLGKVDLVATVEAGGTKSQAGAIRLGVARALCSFLDNEQDREKLRLAGLLTRDPRTHERKKPGQRGAREKFPWRKR